MTGALPRRGWRERKSATGRTSAWTRRRGRVGVALLALAIAGLPEPTPAVEPQVIQSERHAFRVVVLVEGLENPWGLAFLPDGRLLVTERPGRLRLIANGTLDPRPIGGLPAIAVQGTGFRIGEGTARPDVAPPLHVWVPSIAPSGMAFYGGDRFPRWRGSLFVGALVDRSLVRLELDGERVVREERLMRDAIGRIRDVRAGPDGVRP